MAWETRDGSRRYYTRSRRVNGKILREYVGSGILGQIAHRLDLAERANRAEERRSAEQMKQLDRNVESLISEFDRLADGIGRGLMIVAGFHQHKRCEWRKRKQPECNE